MHINMQTQVSWIIVDSFHVLFKSIRLTDKIPYRDKTTAKLQLEKDWYTIYIVNFNIKCYER